MLPTTVPRMKSARARRLSRPVTVSEPFGGKNHRGNGRGRDTPLGAPEFCDQQHREQECKQSALLQIECNKPRRRSEALGPPEKLFGSELDPPRCSSDPLHLPRSSAPE